MTEWNKILREKLYNREEPEEIVIDFAAQLKARNKKLRVLDLGCGGGRHQICIARQGFEAHGADISETGLNLTQERLQKQSLEGYVVKCDMKQLPYLTSCFDAVICLHAIYHQKLKGIKETISEIHRILDEKGLLLVNFLSKRTYSYGKGSKVERDTFMEQTGLESGVLHHFTSKEEIMRLFRKFEILSLELVEKEVEGKLRSRWILIAITIQ